MSNHTPGPWKATCLDRKDDRVTLFWDVEQVRKPGQLYRGGVATVHASEHIDGVTIEERDANARLITAAPDLLEAAKYLLRAFDRDIITIAMPHETERHFLVDLRAAVDKAEGRS